MKDTLKKAFSSSHWQLNAIGIFLLSFLALNTWWLLRQPTNLLTIVPLSCVGYVAINIIYELTLNRANVPTLATSLMGCRRITQLLQQVATQSGAQPYKIVDLGSGRGGLTRRMARAIPHAQVIGIEKSRIPYVQSMIMQRLFGITNLRYQRLDFWTYACTEIDAVFVYLTPKLSQQAGEKLFHELKPGCVIISYMFPLLGTWTPTETVHFHTPFKEVIYVYRKS